jgi:Uncharacterized iron-regulated membrane protein
LVTSAFSATNKQNWLNYRTIWRWHFYAGVFCIPFVMWLSATGSIYLFRPQIETFLDRPYEHLQTASTRKSADLQISSALAAVPGANLHFYQLPRNEHSAVQIVVGRGASEFRVYVNPYNLQVLNVQNEDDRPMQRVFHLHGQLLLGDQGSWIVETAASWAVIMILSGIFLWWPRSTSSLAGTLYPRLHSGSRILLRDAHAVTGVWVSAFALFFILSGLPWAKSWGTYLKLARKISGETNIRQDWTTGRSSEIAARLAMGGGAPMQTDEHAAHMGRMSGDMHHTMPMSYDAVNAVLPTVESLHLAFPVLISPPERRGGAWLAKSDSQDRVLRDQVTIDASSGAVLSRLNFAQRPILDRVVGIGVAMHEGQLYGQLNQLVNLCTALGLLTLSASAAAMWWRRRPHGQLGAPPKYANVRVGIGFVILLAGFSLYLPLFGATLLFTLLVERVLLRKIPSASRWLGLDTASPAGYR